MKFTISRVYEQTRKRRTLKTGQSRELAFKHKADPETSWLTATTPEALDYTRKNGPWFDVIEVEDLPPEPPSIGGSIRYAWQKWREWMAALY